jgi:hypothetical protein
MKIGHIAARAVGIAAGSERAQQSWDCDIA